MRDEAQAVLDRYKRRTRRYDPLDPAVNRPRQEFERALIRWIRGAGLAPVENLDVVEFGCGSGGILQTLIRFGFRPERLVGNELQESLAEEARHKLPAATRILSGDALDLDLEAASFDVAVQSVVFSSILDEEFRRNLARKMWGLVKCGGGVLWYDMIYNNPANPDVRGIGMREVRQYFPDAEVSAWRITLAPPICRVVTRVHPALYDWFNSLYFVRTHLLCWLRKSR